jgi:hypothetical protein
VKISSILLGRKPLESSDAKTKTESTSTGSASMPTLGLGRLRGLLQIGKPDKSPKRPQCHSDHDSTSSFGCGDRMMRHRSASSGLSEPARPSPRAHEKPRPDPLPPQGSQETPPESFGNDICTDMRPSSSSYSSLFNKYTERTSTDSLTSGSVYSQSSDENSAAIAGMHAESPCNTALQTAQKGFLSTPPAVKPISFHSPKRVGTHRTKILNSLDATINPDISFLNMDDSETDS